MRARFVVLGGDTPRLREWLDAKDTPVDLDGELLWNHKAWLTERIGAVGAIGREGDSSI